MCDAVKLKPITRQQILDSSKVKEFADDPFEFDENGRKLAKRLILGSFKLKEFAEDNFKFDEDGRKFLKRVENTMWKKENLLIRSNFSFSH